MLNLASHSKFTLQVDGIQPANYINAQWMGWKGSTGDKIPEETGGSLSQVLEGTAWDWKGGSDVRRVLSSYTKSDESKATGGVKKEHSSVNTSIS